jgi:hypothetical protein
MTESYWTSWIELAGKTIGSKEQSPSKYAEANVGSLSRAWKSEQEQDLVFHITAMAVYINAVSGQQVRDLCIKFADKMYKWHQNNERKSFGTELSIEPYFREVQRINLPNKDKLAQQFSPVDEILEIISRFSGISIESVEISAEKIIRLLNSPMGPILASEACYKVIEYAQSYLGSLFNKDVFQIAQYKLLDDEKLFYLLSPALFAMFRLREKLATTMQNALSQAVVYNGTNFIEYKEKSNSLNHCIEYRKYNYKLIPHFA